jgi:histidinol phosphatase-like enzyme
MATVNTTDFRQISKILLTNVLHVNKKVFVKCFMLCMNAKETRNLKNKPKKLMYNRFATHLVMELSVS